MEWTAEIVRGWPADGALERAETIKAATTLVNGDVVEPQSDGTVAKVSATKSNKVGLVVRGNGDSDSAKNSNKAVVLWGNYIVSTTNYAAGAYVPGSPVTAVSGQFALANGTTDPEVGFVLQVVAAVAGSETAHLVIAVR